jgi:hypothetical protein
MFALSVALTVLLLFETLPSAVADLLRAKPGLARLDQLTRLGVLQGRYLWLVSLLGVAHLAGSGAMIAGLAYPVAGVVGAGVEACIFGWVLSRQLAAGDRGRALAAYLLFTALAVAVLAANAVRL